MKNDFLQRVLTQKKFVLPACDGKRIISQAHDVFDNIVWAVGFHNTEGKPTPKTQVAPYQFVTDTTLLEAVYSFGILPHDLSLTQGQVLDFIQKYPQHLVRDKSGSDRNFFLFCDGCVGGYVLVAEVKAEEEARDLRLDLTIYLFVLDDTNRLVEDNHRLFLREIREG